MMYRTLLAIWFVGLVACASGRTVSVVCEPETEKTKRAAEELCSFLERMYDDEFARVPSRPEAGTVIVLKAGSGSGEGYSVKTEQRITTIAAESEAALFYGVYGLLRELGCGFYLSFETVPEKGCSINLSDLDFSDRPLTENRISWNWHNFLSGCTGWNLQDWNDWTARCQRMGFNTIMVHAYGNNPMFSYSFNGKEKPVGYIATTKQGRDWAVNHVNDVRRLHGGDVFDGPVFGAKAALVPDEQRRASAQKLMGQVFDFADARGMKISFAVDFDLPSCNPAELIKTLDEADRFHLTHSHHWFPDGLWLARPDTEAGYQFYKEQAAAMMKAYPQVDTVTLWRRFGGAIFGAKPENLPDGLRKKYEALIAKRPSLEKARQSAGTFIVSEITAAWRRALDELGCEHVELAGGSWGHDHVSAYAAFMPEEVKVVGLDHRIHSAPEQSLKNERRIQNILRGVEPGRFIPIIWAHHDDGEYCGAPYEPFEGFNKRLKDWKAGGFGVMHWTTRPLDIYFASHIRQTWERTENEPSKTTCKVMARDLWGEDHAGALGGYLHRWWMGMPQFGRETADFYMDRAVSKYGDPQKLISGSHERAEWLGAYDSSGMSTDQQAWLEYYRGYELYTAGALSTQVKFEQANAAQKQGKLSKAGALMQECRPEELVENFAAFSRMGRISQGEKGLVVTMNTRWIPHYEKLRQQLGMVPVRYNFGATQHEPLAQNPGFFTFFFSPDQELWQTLGTRETGLNVSGQSVVLQEDMPAWYAEIGREGLVIDEPAALELQTILSEGLRANIRPKPLAAGKHEVELLVASTGTPQFDVSLGLSGSISGYGFKPQKAKFLRIVCSGNNQNGWNSIHEVSCEAIDALVVPTASISSGDKVVGNVVDGDRETRWAAQGEGQWIQFTLKPEVEFDFVGIQFYKGESRTYDFELQVSNDGAEWQTIELDKDAEQKKALGIAKEFARDSVNLKESGRLVALRYPVELKKAGPLAVQITPRDGKVVLCGAVIRPVD